jgi:hypothetical protein
MGEIWISYDIEFYKPVLSITGGDLPTVPGFALTSQRDGSQNPENGAIATMAINQATSVLVGSQTRSLYVSDGSSPAYTGDYGLYGTAFTIGADGRVQFLRNGLYKFQWTLYGSTTSTNFSVATNSFTPTNTIAQFAASESPGTISTITDTQLIPYNLTRTAYSGQLGVVACTVTIRDMPDGETAFINCPQFTAHSTDLATLTVNTFNITWIQASPASILITD